MASAMGTTTRTSNVKAGSIEHSLCERIVAIDQHIAAPVADPDHEHLDLEVCWLFPAAEHIENAPLGLFILDCGAL
jgi:hypothetical protein